MSRSRHEMWRQLIVLSKDDAVGLQVQLRKALIRCIYSGQLSIDIPLPSTRVLSEQLNVSRVTVSLAYQQLVEEGYLLSQERRGYFVNPEMINERALSEPKVAPQKHIDWNTRLKYSVSSQRNIHKPKDWHQYTYPFIFGQMDPEILPKSAWRECWRQEQSANGMAKGGYDLLDQDDNSLIQQLITRVLPKRGIWCEPENVLITMGAQNALSLLAKLLISPDDVVGIENPGYPDARNLFDLETNHLKLLAVDNEGLVVDEHLNDCQFLYVTPSYQSPTTVTLSESRRTALLELADQQDLIIIEDDYESEAAFGTEPIPALKSQDESGRVIYCGSLSKCLSPGLRLGFIVADSAIIEQARALRRLVIRHPPPLIESAVAMFIELGHYDSHINRLAKVYRQRWSLMAQAIDDYLPFTSRRMTFGGTSFWITGPENLDAQQLANYVAEYGILIEPGAVHFGQQEPPANYFRLGFAAIPDHRIEEGVAKLSQLMTQMKA